MKRTCANCKGSDGMHGCSLGYKVKLRWMGPPYSCLQTDSTPLEQYPKPLTNRKAVDMSLRNIPGRAGTMNYR